MLWAAIRATQKRWPKAKCIVYTGDHDVSKDMILARVQVSEHAPPALKLAHAIAALQVMTLPTVLMVAVSWCRFRSVRRSDEGFDSEGGGPTRSSTPTLIGRTF